MTALVFIGFNQVDSSSLCFLLMTALVFIGFNQVDSSSLCSSERRFGFLLFPSEDNLMSKEIQPSFFTTKKEGKKTITYALPTSYGRQAASG